MSIKYKNCTRIILMLAICFLAIAVLYNASNTALRLLYPMKYQEYVYKYSNLHGVDPYMVFAIIKAESNFDPKAVSRKNARGLMQITEKTGSWIAENLKMEDYSTQRLHDPETNIQMGCWYINWLMKYFNNDMDLVITAYNSGSGNVTEWLKDKKLSNSGSSLEKIPFKETDTYVKRVMKNYSMYKKLYEK